MSSRFRLVICSMFADKVLPPFGSSINYDMSQSWIADSRNKSLVYGRGACRVKFVDMVREKAVDLFMAILLLVSKQPCNR